MNASELIAKIREIADEPGRTGKAELMREVVANDFGAWVVNMTYDPFKTYGVKPPMPDKVKGGINSRVFTRNLVEPLLESLRKRELTGGDAKCDVEAIFMALDDDGRDLLWRIMSKDLKAGVGTSTLQMVAPGLVPAFAVMRAQSYEERFVKEWPQKGEFKLDGQRNTFLCKDGSGAFFTRSGKHVPALDFFVPNLLKVGHEVVKQAAADGDLDLMSTLLDENSGLSFMLDGEAMMGLFEETGALRRKDVDAKGAELHLYDMMSYADFDAVGSVGRELEERRELLSKFVRLAKNVLSETDTPDMIQMVPQYFLNSQDDVMRLFDLARTKTLATYLARGDSEKEAHLLKTTIDKATGKPKVLEGIMVKNPLGLYDKKKSRGWLKMKPEETEDLRVIGAYPGEPGTKYEHCLGGLITNRDGIEVRCGGGFSDVEREALWPMYERDLHKFDAVAIKPASRGSGHVIDIEQDDDFTGCELLGRLIEVEFHEVTPDGSLRHPRYIRFRDDKDGELERKEKAA